MTTIILALAGPVLGLFGASLGIWYGQRRWRHDREDRQGDYYVVKRREAYTGLWEVVQDAHMNMRQSLAHAFSMDLAPFLINVNSFAWKHGLYIDDADRTLAQEYLYMVYKFLTLLVENETGKTDPPDKTGLPDKTDPADKTDKDRAIETAREWAVTTAGMIFDVPSTLEAMKVAEDKANAVRDQLRERILVVLGGLPKQRGVVTLADTQGQGSGAGQILEAQFNALLRDGADT